MSKFLKHLGIGTGSKKSSGPADFQAKTLPATAGGKGYGRRETIAAAESCRECASTSSSGSRDVAGGHSTDRTGNGRRASHDSYRTMPARGLRSRPEKDRERDWSLRGPRSRETSSSLRMHNCPANDVSQHSALSGSRRKVEDSKELRRSLTTDEIGSTSGVLTAVPKVQPPPALGEYSDPFDLKVQLPETPEIVGESAVALPLADDDYSVPYDLKDRLKDVVVEDASKLQQETDDNSSKYDDPYEENPIALLRTQISENRVAHTALSSDADLVIGNRLSEQLPVFDCQPSNNQLCVETAEHSLVQQLSAVSVSDSAVNTDTAAMPLAVADDVDVMPAKEDLPKPMRSYELSAEYGGFFVPSAPSLVPAVNAVQDIDKDEDVGCTDYTDLQPLAPLAGASNIHANTGSSTGPATSGLRHASVGLGGGFYDEPWDLSTTQRGLTEKWRQTKQTKDVGIMAVLDSVANQPSELYAQPHKGIERGHHRVVDSNEMRSTGPSYGILCQRVAENGMLAPVSIRDIGTSGCQNGPQRFDLRPVEDYDVPWDQKKSICKTVVCIIRSWYHGSISRKDAENLLRGHQEGSYLIRTSESNKLDYSLSVRSVSGFMHMKIVANQDGRYILGQFSQPFFSIAQMVHYYTVNKLPIKGAEHISLSYPVKHELL